MLIHGVYAGLINMFLHNSIASVEFSFIGFYSIFSKNMKGIWQIIIYIFIAEHNIDAIMSY